MLSFGQVYVPEWAFMVRDYVLDSTTFSSVFHTEFHKKTNNTPLFRSYPSRMKAIKSRAWSESLLGLPLDPVDPNFIRFPRGIGNTSRRKGIKVVTEKQPR